MDCSLCVQISSELSLPFMFVRDVWPVMYTYVQLFARKMCFCVSAVPSCYKQKLAQMRFACNTFTLAMSCNDQLRSSFCVYAKNCFEKTAFLCWCLVREFLFLYVCTSFWEARVFFFCFVCSLTIMETVSKEIKYWILCVIRTLNNINSFESHYLLLSKSAPLAVSEVVFYVFSIFLTLYY